MLEITNFEELWENLPDWFKSHNPENDSDLPFVSEETLWYEYKSLQQACNGNINKALEIMGNYVPTYHGWGLICRAVDIAEKEGLILNPDSFGFIPRY